MREARSEGAREVELLYADLRRLAARLMANERPDHSLQPTALVHEVYLRLAEGSPTTWNDRSHFFRLAAKVMRQILLDHAKARARQKRGGSRARITLDEDLLEAPGGGVVDLLAFDQALNALCARHSSAADVAEMKLFAGATTNEVALALGLSARTVATRWAFAQMWLRRHLSEPDDPKRNA